MTLQMAKTFVRAEFPLIYSLYLRGREYLAPQIFRRIYRDNHWGDRWSVSGPGSSLLATEYIREQISRIIQDLQVTSILDIPCGDDLWMSQIDLRGVRYTGADIVDELIRLNSRRYANDDRQFIVLDITRSKLPSVDLVICRDCLVHFSFRAICRALMNIRSSGSRYLLATTYPHLAANHDIKTGGWRPINLGAHPFDFPDPMLLVNDNHKDARDFEGQNDDKCLGLWSIGTQHLPQSR